MNKKDIKETSYIIIPLIILTVLMVIYVEEFNKFISLFMI